MEESIQSSHGSTPREIVDRIMDDVKSFSAGAEQSDDITLLVLARKSAACETAAR